MSPRVVYTPAAAAKALGMKKKALVDALKDGRVRTVLIEDRERVSQAELQRIQIEGIPPAPVGRPTRVVTRKELAEWKPRR